ncbi:MAG: heavy-metal-associated domain-containing protein [Cyanobacteria bacterium P01_A01_bin.45]
MTLKFKVPDIGCQRCAEKITTSIQNVEADANVDVDVEAKTVLVNSQISESSIKQAIVDAGFQIDDSY